MYYIDYLSFDFFLQWAVNFILEFKESFVKQNEAQTLIMFIATILMQHSKNTEPNGKYKTIFYKFVFSLSLDHKSAIPETGKSSPISIW